MSVAQALAIAAAAWATAITTSPAMLSALHRAQVQVEALATRLDTRSAIRLVRIEGGFRPTRDGDREWALASTMMRGAH